MEVLSVKSQIPFSSRGYLVKSEFQYSNKSSKCVGFGIPASFQKTSSQVSRFRTTSRSKGSQFQDFQTYAEPTQLLQVGNAKFCTEQDLREIIASSNHDSSSSYVLQLRTSNEFGSGLEDMNAAILVCLIDASGNSMLQRISPSLTDEHEEASDSEKIHFRRGSVETITLRGTEMGNIKALWLGLESGSWRLGGARLSVISRKQPRNYDDNSNETQSSGLLYDFEVNDILLGEGGTSMVELRPKLVTEIPTTNTDTLTSTDYLLVSSSSNSGTTSAEGMKEYADLKLSLVVYDFFLVSAGTIILTVSANEKVALAFLFGGISGFLYLLLLQNSVDGLSAASLPSMSEKGENLKQALGGFKGPLSKFTLLMAAFAVVIKFGLGDNVVELTPQELLIGSVGFFTCKIAVILAASKPLVTSSREE